MTTELAALRERLEKWETDDDPTETTTEIIRDCLALAERQQAEIERMKRLLLEVDPLGAMTNEQRLALFSNYCVHCGAKDPTCQCWNDE